MEIDPITGLPSSNVQRVYAGDKPISPAPVISATKIGTTTASPVPSPVVPTINPTQATQMASYVDASSQTAEQQAAQQAQMEADAQKARGQAMMTDYAQSQALLGGKQGDLATAYNTKDETGNSVNSLAAQLRQLNAQAQGLQLDTLAKQQGEINKATGQNITQQAVARNTADATRENLINMATIGIKTAIAKADYDTAKSYADQMVDAKYSQMEANLKSKEIQMNWVLEQDIKPAQKAVAEAKLREYERGQQKLQEEKADRKLVENMIIEAAPVAPPDVIAKARKLAESGASKLAVAQALGVYSGDYLKNELLKEELKKVKADRITTSTPVNGVTVGGSIAGSPASSAAKNWLAQYNSGALELGDIYTKIGSSKEASVIKNELAGLVAAQGGKRVYGMDDATIAAINSQIKNVDDLLSGGVGKIVGVVQGGLGIFPDKLNVGKQDALAIAKNLTSNQTLQALADAKSKGITFGALSEKELSVVAESASRIAAKLEEDPKTKKITGFSGSEKEFIKDLNAVKEGLQKSIQGKTQTNNIMSSNPQLNNWYQSTSQAVDKSTAATATLGGTYGFQDNQ